MNYRAVIIIPLLAFIGLLFVSITVYSLNQYALPGQNTAVSATPMPPTPGVAVYQVPGRLPLLSGGGEWQFPDDHISDAHRRDIEAALAANIEQLTAAGLSAERVDTAVTLAWPLQAAPHLNDFGYHGMANFVDHNPAFPYQRLDYFCGQRTYDTQGGYNHPGTDIFTWPFPWNRMDNDEVMVVAAAPGIIVLRQDGNFDRNCSFTSLPWNAVYVQHADGSVAWYGHLKNGSLTPKGIGQGVAAGEYLGIVGSSGSSTAPHLHLELHSASGATLDPFAGACNVMNPVSFWGEQPPYYDTAVNKITTGYAAPVLSSCSAPEYSHEADSFEPGDTIFFTTYYRDQLGSVPSHYIIYQPDGTVYQSWAHNIPQAHYAASWWWWSFAFPANIPQGQWQFVVAVSGQTYTHTFLVGTLPPPPVELPAVITVTAPNGGEVISPGAVLTVSWQTALTTAWQVDLVHNSLPTETLTTSAAISGTGSITWTTPLTMSTGLYRIRVTDVFSPTHFDESDGSFIIGVLTERVHLPLVRRP